MREVLDRLAIGLSSIEDFDSFELKSFSRDCIEVQVNLLSSERELSFNEKILLKGLEAEIKTKFGVTVEFSIAKRSKFISFLKRKLGGFENARRTRSSYINRATAAVRRQEVSKL